jgi:hypothetical protein
MAPPARARARGQHQCIACSSPSSTSPPRSEPCSTPSARVRVARCRAAAAPQQKRRRCAHERVLRQRIPQRRQQSAAPPCPASRSALHAQGPATPTVCLLVSRAAASSLPIAASHTTPKWPRRGGACASSSCHLERRPIVGMGGQSKPRRQQQAEEATHTPSVQPRRPSKGSPPRFTAFGSLTGACATARSCSCFSSAGALRVGVRGGSCRRRRLHVGGARRGAHDGCARRVAELRQGHLWRAGPRRAIARRPEGTAADSSTSAAGRASQRQADPCARSSGRPLC